MLLQTTSDNVSYPACTNQSHRLERRSVEQLRKSTRYCRECSARRLEAAWKSKTELKILTLSSPRLKCRQNPDQGPSVQQSVLIQKLLRHLQIAFAHWSRDTAQLARFDSQNSRQSWPCACMRTLAVQEHIVSYPHTTCNRLSSRLSVLTNATLRLSKLTSTSPAVRCRHLLAIDRPANVGPGLQWPR
jgi:hypothetical protein